MSLFKTLSFFLIALHCFAITYHIQEVRLGSDYAYLVKDHQGRSIDRLPYNLTGDQVHISHLDGTRHQLQVNSVLGEGVYGRVFEVTNSQGQVLAIKFLTGNGEQLQVLRQNAFSDDIHSLRVLANNDIDTVRVYSQDHYPYLLESKAGGQTLAETLINYHTLTSDEKVRFISALNEASDSYRHLATSDLHLNNLNWDGERLVVFDPGLVAHHPNDYPPPPRFVEAIEMLRHLSAEELHLLRAFEVPEEFFFYVKVASNGFVADLKQEPPVMRRQINPRSVFNRPGTRVFTAAGGAAALTYYPVIMHSAWQQLKAGEVTIQTAMAMAMAFDQSANLGVMISDVSRAVRGLRNVSPWSYRIGVASNLLAVPFTVTGIAIDTQRSVNGEPVTGVDTLGVGMGMIGMGAIASATWQTTSLYGAGAVLTLAPASGASVLIASSAAILASTASALGLGYATGSIAYRLLDNPIILQYRDVEYGQQTLDIRLRDGHDLIFDGAVLGPNNWIVEWRINNNRWYHGRWQRRRFNSAENGNSYRDAVRLLQNIVANFQEIGQAAPSRVATLYKEPVFLRAGEVVGLPPGLHHRERVKEGCWIYRTMPLSEDYHSATRVPRFGDDELFQIQKRRCSSLEGSWQSVANFSSLNLVSDFFDFMNIEVL